MVKRLEGYRDMGRKTFAQLNDQGINRQPEPHSNSIVTIVRHLHGNMMSRFTNFLNEDGEKAFRNRDAEFAGAPCTKEELLQLWEDGWNCILNAVKSLGEADLEKTITIRSEPHTVVDAINRQLGHYAYHTGQIVYLAKLILSGKWETLSIAPGQSDTYTANMREKFGPAS
jgi:Protein of unknown function (DUF1572)